MEYLAVLLPSAAVGAIFYFVMRSIFNADRTERAAMAEAERAQDRKDADAKNPAADELEPEEPGR
ncbi:hypothetical protein [Arthrobacter sp. H5]|uniref:hypothetical protein n=1 Tax=Arthrobacter sp. H5 TaxID=1267973 RepID=UPI00048437A5|nr:hypothetical protein [Arthrobacter sp. H5]